MKKYICLILIMLFSFLVASCNNLNESDVSKYLVKDAKKELAKNINYGNAEYDLFLEKLESFSVKLSSVSYERYFETFANMTISPVSIYMALAMTAEATTGNARKEILEALGMSYDEISEFTKNLYAARNKQYKESSRYGKDVIVAFEQLRNSLWVDDNLEVRTDTLENLADNYYVSTYKVPFQTNLDEAADALSNFVKEKTNGLIDKEYQLSPRTIFALVNTYYLKDIWNDFGNDLEFTDIEYDFTEYSGNKVSTKLLEGYYINGKVFETDTFKHFYTKTQHGYQIKFILPKDGYSIDDVYTIENIKFVNNISDYQNVDYEKKERYYTRCLFPEFYAEFDEDIKTLLKEDFGINEIFIPSTTSFNNLIDGEVYVDSVIHQTKLAVNKKGIEGAAVTIVIGAGAAGPDELTDVYSDLVIDESFGFIITDYQGTILFSGVIKEI